MQIVVNTRMLIKDRLDGIGWFAFQTLRRITVENPHVHFVFLFDRAYDESFIFAPNVTPLILSPPARHPVLYYLWFEVSVKNLLNRLKPDLFLSPDGFLALGATCKQLAVIHDINFLHYPKDSRWLTSRYYNYFFPKFAAKATRIATVSEYSKRDISEHYRIDPANIDVVYNGINAFIRPVSEEEKVATRHKYTGGNEFFICVGSLHPRKNIVTLIRAFAAFKRGSNTAVKLVLAGHKYWGIGEMTQTIAHEKMEESVIFTGRLADDDLALVLGSALALTFVPYYEGFGIPLVEAMEAQVPVICSNVTSLAEVAGPAAMLVNPFDVEAIRNAMMQIEENTHLRKILVEKGNLQKQKFSWDQSAGLLWQSVLKATDHKADT